MGLTARLDAMIAPSGYRTPAVQPVAIATERFAVGMTTGYGHDRGFGVRVRVGSTIFSFPSRPDRLWGPPTLISNGYRGLFARG
jgi:hypothetical protein